MTCRFPLEKHERSASRVSYFGDLRFSRQQKPPSTKLLQIMQLVLFLTSSNRLHQLRQTNQPAKKKEKKQTLTLSKSRQTSYHQPTRPSALSKASKSDPVLSASLRPIGSVPSCARRALDEKHEQPPGKKRCFSRKQRGLS